MVLEDLRPSKIMTKQSFENAIAVASVLGASSNCPPHLIAIARHMGIELSLEDWQRVGENIPLIVNCMPAGKYLGEGFHRAGGVPAVLHELQKLVYYTKIVHRLAVKQLGKLPKMQKPQMQMSFSLMNNLLNMVPVSLCSVVTSLTAPL